MNNEQDQAYFVKRTFASLKAAEMAADGFVKLVHLDFAGRYSIAATRLLAAGQPEACRGSNISASSFVNGPPPVDHLAIADKHQSTRRSIAKGRTHDPLNEETVP